MQEETLTCLVFDSDVPGTTYRLAATAVERHETETLKARSDTNIGLINDKEIISYSFDLDKGIEGAELDDAVEIRMFQDAGLNHMIDYKIVYSWRDSLLDTKSISISAYALTAAQLGAAFGSFKSRCNYIDRILPHATLPYALYAAEVLEKKSDIYIYFQEKSTSVSVFYGGEFVYAKTLPSGLKQLHESFVRNNNEGVSYDDFILAITQKGVDGTRYAPDGEIHIQDVTEVFERAIADKNNVIQYARRIAGLEGFERIFIGTCKGVVPKLNLMTRAALGIEAFDFDQQGDAYIDQHIILAMIEAQNIASGRKGNPFNLTLYPRPPKLLQRESGKLFLGTAAALLVSLLYPGYLWVDALWKGYRYDTTLAELKISRDEFETLRSKEENLKNEKERYQLMLESEKVLLGEKLALLESIESKQAGNQSKAVVLQELYRNVNRHQVKIHRLEVTKNRYRLELQAANDDDFTALLRSLTGHKNFDVAMDTFFYDKGLKRFVTTIFVEVRP